MSDFCDKLRALKQICGTCIDEHPTNTHDYESNDVIKIFDTEEREASYMENQETQEENSQDENVPKIAIDLFSGQVSNNNNKTQETEHVQHKQFVTCEPQMIINYQNRGQGYKRNINKQNIHKT